MEMEELQTYRASLYLGEADHPRSSECVLRFGMKIDKRCESLQVLALRVKVVCRKPDDD